MFKIVNALSAFLLMLMDDTLKFINMLNGKRTIAQFGFQLDDIVLELLSLAPLSFYLQTEGRNEWTEPFAVINLC